MEKELRDRTIQEVEYEQQQESDAEKIRYEMRVKILLPYIKYKICVISLQANELSIAFVLRGFPAALVANTGTSEECLHRSSRYSEAFSRARSKILELRLNTIMLFVTIK